jgi:hypothetical protein
MFIDEIDDVAVTDPMTRWRTADNYNPSRPFNAIDHVVVAIGPSDLPDGPEREISQNEFRPTPV